MKAALPKQQGGKKVFKKRQRRMIHDEKDWYRPAPLRKQATQRPVPWFASSVPLPVHTVGCLFS
jgi:hypothetical protein